MKKSLLTKSLLALLCAGLFFQSSALAAAPALRTTGAQTLSLRSAPVPLTATEAAEATAETNPVLDQAAQRKAGASSTTRTVLIVVGVVVVAAAIVAISTANSIENMTDSVLSGY